MHAPSPQQQPESRPATVAGYFRIFWRKVFGALRPTNPFRTAKGIAVTGPTTNPPPPRQQLQTAPGPPARADYVREKQQGPSF
jgi:hypothetical protein